MTRMLTRRDVLKGIGGVAAAGAVGSLGPASPVEAQRRFDGETLRVQFWAGSEGQTIRSGVVDPFVQKTGAKVVVAEGWTSASIAKLRAEKANPSTSVYLMDDIGVVSTGREGLLEPLDLSRLPNAVDIQPKFFIEGRGAGFFTYVRERLGGFETVDGPPPGRGMQWKKEISAFPEYYERYFGSNMRGVAPNTQLVCRGPVTYRGQEAVRQDIGNLKAALAHRLPLALGIVAQTGLQRW